MANAKLFPKKTAKKSVPVATGKNLAGGVAYDMTSEHALCQYVTTGTLNGTYYANEDTHFATVKALVDKVRPEIVAKAAVYGAENAKMKDMPAFLLAVLAANGEISLLRKAFPRVIKNVKMLCNFVQIIRSGAVGRKSFGTAVKALIVDFLKTRTPKDLFVQHFGHANPSVADIIKMVHPRPSSPVESATYGYLIGKDVSHDNLPFIVQQFELFKAGKTTEVPNLDYRALSNCKLTVDQWKVIARNMPWNMLRMNLNKLNKEGVFNDKALVNELAAKLADTEQVRKYNVFPYQLMTTYQNVEADLPTKINVALQDALDAATVNVPDFGETAVLVDVSGSMNSAITGNRGSVTTKTRCVDVAALIAASVLRKNPDATIVQFDTTARALKLNPRDSVMTNLQKIAANGGGTDVSCGLHYLRKSGSKAKTVIIVSDNESWFRSVRSYGYLRGTAAAEEWNKYSTIDSKGSKLVCIDLTPNTTMQVPDSKNVLNIGGFTDNVFDVIKNFVDGDTDKFVDVVQNVNL